MSALLYQHHFPTIYTGTENISEYNKGKETPADGLFAVIKEWTPDWNYLLYSLYNLKEWTVKVSCSFSASDINDRFRICKLIFRMVLKLINGEIWSRHGLLFYQWLLFAMPPHELHIVLVVTLSQAHLFFPRRPIQLLKLPFCSRQTKWSELTLHTPDQCCL